RSRGGDAPEDRQQAVRLLAQLLDQLGGPVAAGVAVGRIAGEEGHEEAVAAGGCVWGGGRGEGGGPAHRGPAPRDAGAGGRRGPGGRGRPGRPAGPPARRQFGGTRMPPRTPPAMAPVHSPTAPSPPRPACGWRRAAGRAAFGPGRRPASATGRTAGAG